MLVVYLLLFVLALVCFGAATANRPSRVNLVAAGLFLVTLVWAVQALLKVAD